jgi:hypothetical protein
MGMSTAFLITIPLMLLAVGVAVAPLLVMSIREHRLLTGQRSRHEVSAPRAPARTTPSVVEQDADAQAAVIVLEEATIAVNRLRARRDGATNADVDESLRLASVDLRRALVSLGDVAR